MSLLRFFVVLASLIFFLLDELISIFCNINLQIALSFLLFSFICMLVFMMLVTSLLNVTVFNLFSLITVLHEQLQV